MYLSVQHCPHDGVKSSFSDQVVDVYGGRLSNTVRAVLRLFDVSRVPVELSEDHMRGGCECQTLKSSRKVLQHFYFSVHICITRFFN